MTLHLLLPGLHGPMPRLAEAEATPNTPNLNRLLGRAKRLELPGSAAELLFHFCGIDRDPGDRDLPTAALCRLADGGEPTDAYVLHADPVYLRPDQDRLLLFDAEQGLDIGPDEATAFADAFNSHFAGEGLRLETPHGRRWYLLTDERPDLQTSPLGEVIGRNVDAFLPRGMDASHWRRWMNEAQMLFHSLPVNAGREARGEAPVNGIWLSGGGELPTASGPAVISEIQGGGVLVDGLCQLSGLPRACEGAGLKDDALIIIESLQRAVWDADPFAWIAALETIDPIVGRHMQTADELRVYPSNSIVYQWKPVMRWHFWQRGGAVVEMC